MISSKNERVFIWDLSDFTLQIIFDAWWAVMNVGLKLPVAWNDSRHAPLWRFYLHCSLEGTGIPGIIYIICHEVIRHPSQHGSSSMRKYLLARTHIAKLNELTKLELTGLTCSMVDETALPILRRQGSRGMSIVSSQMKFISNIQVWSIFTELIEKMVQTGREGLWNFKVSPRHVESLLHVTICFGSFSMTGYLDSRATMVL